jgi:hypothetical protein
VRTAASASARDGLSSLVAAGALALADVFVADLALSLLPIAAQAVARLFLSGSRIEVLATLPQPAGFGAELSLQAFDIASLINVLAA